MGRPAPSCSAGANSADVNSTSDWEIQASLVPKDGNGQVSWLPTLFTAYPINGTEKPLAPFQEHSRLVDIAFGIRASGFIVANLSDTY